MIKINGEEFDFACGSGAMAFDGRGWLWDYPLRWLGIIDPRQFVVVIKTLTLEPTKGNLQWNRPWHCAQPIGDGNWVNAIGLTNMGIKAWRQTYERRMEALAAERNESKKIRYAISVMPTNEREAQLMGAHFRNAPCVYIEMNASCPNVKACTEIVNMALSLAEHSNKQIVMKLSYDQCHDDRLIRELTKHPQHIGAIHAINTVPWAKIISPQRSPLRRYLPVDGGVSGPAIFAHAKMAIRHIKYITNLPIIGGGGISSFDDVLELKQAGAKGFSIGTLFLSRPWRVKRIINEYRNHEAAKAETRQRGREAQAALRS